ncbi:MAG TPA: hypothetical protein VMP11_16295 [Verrucomicrobiae bacterium]|nr:hypothetical protein [Verrucomicrobiae bacterium]
MKHLLPYLAIAMLATAFTVGCATSSKSAAQQPAASSPPGEVYTPAVRAPSANP